MIFEAVELCLDSLGLVIVFIVNCLLFLYLHLHVLVAQDLQFFDENLDLLCCVVVVFAHSLLFKSLELLNFLKNLTVKMQRVYCLNAHILWLPQIRGWNLRCLSSQVVLRVDCAQKVGLVGSNRASKEPEGKEPDLVKNIHLVVVIFVKNYLQELARAVQIDSLLLSGREVRVQVGVKTEMAQLFKVCLLVIIAK